MQEKKDLQEKSTFQKIQEKPSKELRKEKLLKERMPVEKLRTTISTF